MTALPPLVRVQSVKPDLPEPFVLLGGLVWALFVAPALLMVSLSAAHGLWPTVPGAGYTTCFLLLLGYRAIFSRPSNPGWGR